MTSRPLCFPAQFENISSFRETRTVISNTNIKEMEKIGKLLWGLAISSSPIPKKKQTKGKPQCFLCVVDRSLDDVVDGAQVKTTKYAAKYAGHVFEGNFGIKILQ